MYENNHLASCLRQSSLGRDDAIFAHLENGSTLTYGDLFKGAEKYGQCLIELGVNPGDRVAVQVEKSIEVIKLYLGTIMAGGVFLPLNTAYVDDEIAYFLNDTNPVVFVCDPAKVDRLTPVAKSAQVQSVQTLDAEGKGTLQQQSSQQSGGQQSRGQQSEGMQWVDRGPDDLAAILYTSGTTGRSKGAMLSHANLTSNAKVLADYWQFSQDDVLIHALPIFHAHGLFISLNMVLTVGASVHYMAKFDADKVIDKLPISTALLGVPTFYTRLLDHPKLSRDITQNIRIFVSGSAPMLKETHMQWQDRTGKTIIERYGLTETSINSSSPYDGDIKIGTVGLPLPDIEIKITDPEKDGVEVDVNQVGVLEVKGPNVFGGYWQMPEKTKEELRDNGFFITGDLASIDKDGYISIIGRNKDLIISGGYNVYPKEVESIIDEIDGVVESAVIGAPHKDFGEGVVAIVVPQQDKDLDEATILAGLKDKLARFKQPKKTYFVDSLPRNVMGKVQKKALRDEYVHTFDLE